MSVPLIAHFARPRMADGYREAYRIRRAAILILLGPRRYCQAYTMAMPLSASAVNIPPLDLPGVRFELASTADGPNGHTAWLCIDAGHARRIINDHRMIYATLNVDARFLITESPARWRWRL